MFRAVRHWWESGRGKVTARLLVFELFVVIVLVFIAQAFANWVQHRGELERMERSDRFASREMALSYGCLGVAASFSLLKGPLGPNHASCIRGSGTVAVAHPAPC